MEKRMDEDSRKGSILIVDDSRPSIDSIKVLLEEQNRRLQQEIVKRKAAQEALRASEESYSTLVESSSDAILILDPQRRVLSCNEAFLQLFGYARSEVGGQSIRIIHGSDMSYRDFGDKIYPVIRASGTCRTEWEFVNRDGTPFPVETVTSAMKSSDGSVQGYVAIIRDITERRRAEQAHLESEAQKRAILDASIDRIRIVDKDLRIIWANKNTASSLHRAPEELVGKTCYKALSGRDTPCVGCPTLRARETGRIERAVMYQPGAGGIAGGTYWDNYSVPLKNEAGEITGLVQVARNVTAQRRMEQALRESEARYRLLVEQIPAVTYSTELDEAGTTLYVSPQIEGMVGFTQSECSRYPDIWRRQLHSEDRDRVLSEVARTRETGEPLRTEYRMLHREGHVVWLRDEAVIVKDSTGRPLHLQGIRVDISRAKQAEEQIHLLSQELMKAHERERRMISLELHDRVAQDLSTVKLGMDTLLDSRSEASGETKNQFSDLSRILQGTITAVRDLAYDLRPPSLDQLGLVQSIYQYCEDFSQKTGLVVDFTCAGIDELQLDSDTEINLYRLVQEGLINVRKHAKATRVIIRLVASFPDIILRITDDGMGFDVEKRQRSLTGEKRMGLRSMGERVRWLGGAMDIKSAPGKGTKIVIRIPHKERELGAEENAVDRG
ncbi:MAG: PAS domain S-box protein [Deltaproteobacteria bacterium]|nr:PAS domain S-box protein [Deltaproteobacteria bacterium]